MRGWRESDLAPWAAMNADPEVRQYLGPLLTFEQASAWVLRGHGYATEAALAALEHGFHIMGLPESLSPWQGTCARGP
jgi:RimJ/RimL family protein N-acetyltransferase